MPTDITIFKIPAYKNHSKKHYAFRLNEAVVERLDWFRRNHTDLGKRTELIEEALNVYLAFLEETVCTLQCSYSQKAKNHE